MTRPIGQPVRSLLSRPMSTVLAVLTLGIGVASTLFVADAVLLRPRFLRAPDRLVNVGGERNGRAASDRSSSLPSRCGASTWQLAWRHRVLHPVGGGCLMGGRGAHQ